MSWLQYSGTWFFFVKTTTIPRPELRPSGTIPLQSPPFQVTISAGWSLWFSQEILSRFHQVKIRSTIDFDIFIFFGRSPAHHTSFFLVLLQSARTFHPRYVVPILSQWFVGDWRLWQISSKPSQRMKYLTISDHEKKVQTSFLN